MHFDMLYADSQNNYTHTHVHTHIHRSFIRFRGMQISHEVSTNFAPILHEYSVNLTFMSHLFPICHALFPVCKKALFVRCGNICLT